MKDTYTVEIGADVAKNNLRVHVEGKQADIKNSKTEITAWLKLLKKKYPSFRVSCESTGGYENILISACLEHGVPVSQINPAFIKAFIKSFGKHAKTDPIDAEYIARFARERNPGTLDEQWLQTKRRYELQQRIDFLTSENASRKSALDKYENKAIIAEIKREITATTKKIAKHEREMQKLIDEDPDLKCQQQLLESVSSIGRKTSFVILNTLPELGQVNRTEIASLVGIAPMHNDSGKMKGKRTIQGGRKRPRTALYMACVSAIAHNPVISKAYQHLREDQGKPHRVAMIAVARKLLVYLNSLFKKEIYGI